jgi:hypothetical protein
VDLREESHVRALIVRLDGRAHARAAGAYDEHVVRGFHCG